MIVTNSERIAICTVDSSGRWTMFFHGSTRARWRGNARKWGDPNAEIDTGTISQARVG